MPAKLKRKPVPKKEEIIVLTEEDILQLIKEVKILNDKCSHIVKLE